MSGEWKIRIDEDRTLKLELNGSFNVSEDKSRAEAGETDVIVETFGVMKVSNVSDGREFDPTGFGDWDTGIQLFVPITACPDWEPGENGSGEYCSRDIVQFDVPALDVDESVEIDLDGEEKVTAVSGENVQSVIDAMLGDDAAIVHADRVFWNDNIEKLNPTCEFGSDSKWVTYFSEKEDVTACSTEPGAS